MNDENPQSLVARSSAWHGVLVVTGLECMVTIRQPAHYSANTQFTPVPSNDVIGSNTGPTKRVQLLYNDGGCVERQPLNSNRIL
jgi:hypothetical protein